MTDNPYRLSEQSQRANQTASSRRIGPRILLGIAALIIAAGWGVTTLMLGLIGHEDFAIERLNRCPEAVELLGGRIEKNQWGWSCGNAEVSGGHGFASWSLAVRGPDGDPGIFRFQAEQSAGRWRLTAGNLEAGPEMIDIMNCAPNVAPIPPEPQIE